MNGLPKVVFSRTLDAVSWNNTRLMKGELAAEVRALKREPGPSMVIMGSGSIVSQLAEAGLVDEYQIVVNPIVLGKGRTLFDGVTASLRLKLISSRIFGNGNAVLSYVAA
jgi:dihydrofolate reductase